MSYGEFLKFVAMSKVVPRLRVTINQAGAKPVAGDTLSLSVPAGWTVTGAGATIDRGAGPVSLFTGVGPYTLQSADIPPIGSTWPIVATGTLSAVSSPVFGLSNPVVAPGAPTIGTLTASANAVSQAFTAPVSNGGAAITNYQLSVYRASDNVLLGQANGSASPLALAGLANDIAVYGKVAAQNSVGYGAQSAASNTATPSAIAQVDVLIYGATWQGVVAAIVAQQQGLSYLLVSELDDLGGMMTSGVNLTDALSYPAYTRATIPKDTLTNELFERLATRYSKNQQAMYRDQSYSSESKSTLAEIQAMMTKYGVTYTPNAYLTGVSMSGGKMVSATFNGVGTVSAKVFMDCSYISELLAASGADYFYGSEAAATYGESAQGAGWYTAGGQPTNNIDPYIVSGVSASGLIKYVQPSTIAQTAGTAVLNKVQAMGYRLSITQQAGQKTAIPDPSDATGNYATWPRLADYELHRRWFQTNGSGITQLVQYFNLQTSFGFINSTTSTAKRDANTSGFISLDFPDVFLSSEYAAPGTTRARRLEIQEIIKQYTLGLIYFLKNDSSVSAAMRSDTATWGFCSDDYTATGGLPPRVYCRAGIHALGDLSPVTAPDIAALNAVADPLAFSFYAYDAHIRQYYDNAGKVWQEGHTPLSMTQSMQMARISMKILFPKKAQASNLILTWGGNMTNAAYNAIRVEPLMGVLAESAGYVAVAAVQNNIAVQDVNYATMVAPKLPLFGNNKAGAIVISADGTSWNSGGGGGHTVARSGYSLTTLANQPYGTAQVATCALTSGTNTVTLTPNISVASNYRVELKYIDSSSVTVRGNVSVVTTASGVDQTAVVINESYTANTCGDWQDVGTFAFTTGLTTANKVVVTHDNSANSSNVLGVRFIKVP